MTSSDQQELERIETDKRAAMDPSSIMSTDDFKTFMRAELESYRRQLGLSNPPGQNGVPMVFKRGEHLIRTRSKLPEAASLEDALKKAGIGRKGRRAYLAAHKVNAKKKRLA